MLKFRRIMSLVLTFVLLAAATVLPANAATTDEQESGATYYNLNKYSSQIYSGEDLGSTYSPTSTTWKVWSPGATSVKLKIYKTGSDNEAGAGVVGTYDLEKSSSFSSNGIWELTLTGDYKNLYYTYLVTCDGQTKETQDVYSRATGVNGNRTMVVDLDSTDPEGWSSDKHVLFDNMTEAAVWEVHIRDFSIADNSGISETNKGKYLAFTEGGTTLNSDTSADAVKTGIDYLVEQGINCVQIMPMYDFASVKEDKASSSTNRNWGYDPQNYNVPEGSYSSNPYDGNVRITEMKQMIQALHDRGISVVMDVVYNHTFVTEESCFGRTVPGYYYRMSNSTTYINGSGCGNVVATENQMARNYITQSVKYWADEYHIDGFRFDLMGCIDVATMNAVRTALDGLYSDGSGKKILVYGEPWEAAKSYAQTGATTANASKLNSRVGMFSDGMRNALTGGTDASNKGWIEGVTDNTGAVVNGMKASIVNSSNTTQTVTYAACHDNYALWDHLTRGAYDSTSSTYINEMKVAYGATLLSQGIKFGLAGDEFARTKRGDHNSYKSSDAVNKLDWSRVKTYSSLVNYIKGLRLLNEVYTPFHDDTTTSKNAMNFVSSKGYVVGYTLENKTSNASNEWGKVAVLINSGTQGYSISLGSSGWTVVANENSAGITSLGTVSGSSYTVPARSVAVLVESSTFSRLKNATPTYGTLTTEHYVDGVLKKSATATYRTGSTYRALPDQDILFDANVEKVEGTTSGTVTQGMSNTVKYYYKSTGVNSGYLTVKYVDASGKSIADDSVTRYREGDSYQVPAISKQGYQLDTAKYPADTYGTFDGNSKTITFTYNQLSSTSTVVHYYNSNNWSNVRCYAYTDDGVEPNGTWDTATIMTSDSSMGSGWLKATIPAGSCYVMFHPASGSSQEPGQGASGYPVSGEGWIQNKTVTFNCQIITSHIDEATGKQLTADEVQSLNKVTSSGTYSTSPKTELGTVIAAPVNASGNYTAGVTNVVYLYNTGVVPTTSPVTTSPQPTTQPATSVSEIIIGDTNLNNIVDIRDASLLQSFLAKSDDLTQYQKMAADVDGDETISIRDATCIQSYLAKDYSNSGNAGKVIEIVMPTTPPEPTTQPVTEAPTTAPPTTEPPTTEPPAGSYTVKFSNSQHWSGTIYCYYWADDGTAPAEWPGTQMTFVKTNDYGEDVYSIDVPSSYTNLIFTNNAKKQTNDIVYDGSEGYYASTTTSTDLYGNTVYQAKPWA